MKPSSNDILVSVLNAASYWVWPHDDQSPNQYAEFRQIFPVKDPSLGALAIGADANYAVWVNGRFVDCGQYHDFPDTKTIDLLDITPYLQQGDNLLCVLAHYQGTPSSQYLPGQPGVLYGLSVDDLLIISGPETRCRMSALYQHGELERMSPQLGYIFICDAGADDGWRFPEYQCGGEWQAPCTRPVIAASIQKRPVRKCHIRPCRDGRVLAEGSCRRGKEGGASIAAQMMATDVCPNSITGEGRYFLLDLGREETGLLEIELKAPAGTIVDIAWGEHLDDGRVRALIGPRHFAGRYICREGRQRFTAYLMRVACRYLELHCFPSSGDVTLLRAGVRPVEYPVDAHRHFACAAGEHNAIWQTARRTLHLCMHEHYEDSPWREQALYAMDARIQALCGYYAFGEYDFAAASLDLLGKSIGDDGFVALCAPASHQFTIPAFSMAWIIAVWEHLLFSGDERLVRRWLPRIRTMLDAFAGHLSEGLLASPCGSRYWHFYDWTHGLDGYAPPTYKQMDWLTTRRFDAPLHGMYCLALDAARRMEAYCGEPERSLELMVRLDAVRSATHVAFWDPAAEAYASYVDPRGRRSGPYAELVQAVMIVSGVCPEEQSVALRRRLTASGNGFVPATLSQSIYLFDAVMQEPQRYGAWMLERVAQIWGHMLAQGATSFWETERGSADFDGAGSLCHGWSAIPAYVYPAYVLGVTPLEPGFASYHYQPLTMITERAEGAVPTPQGDITIHWGTTSAGELSLTHQHPSTLRVHAAEAIHVSV